MTTRQHLSAAADILAARHRGSTKTELQIAERTAGCGMADLIADMARESGAPPTLILAALGALRGHEEAVEGFLGRLQQLLAEVPHGNA